MGIFLPYTYVPLFTVCMYIRTSVPHPNMYIFKVHIVDVLMVYCIYVRTYCMYVYYGCTYVRTYVQYSYAHTVTELEIAACHLPFSQLNMNMAEQN